MSQPKPERALVARTILALNRPVQPHAAPARAVDMLREPAFAVWYDPVHSIRIDTHLALRALDDAEGFCWLVRGPQGRDGLSRAIDPVAAIVEVRNRPAHALPADDAGNGLARALRRREIRLRLAESDFEGPSARYAILGKLGMPGWAAAWLVPLTPELGPALQSAHRRTTAARTASGNA